MIPKENFGAYVKPLIVDFPELITKVDAKIYKYENIEELVKEYNRLKQ